MRVIYHNRKEAPQATLASFVGCCTIFQLNKSDIGSGTWRCRVLQRSRQPSSCCRCGSLIFTAQRKNNRLFFCYQVSSLLVTACASFASTERSARFAAMKDGACLVNTARGGVIVSSADLCSKAS